MKFVFNSAQNNYKDNSFFFLEGSKVIIFNNGQKLNFCLNQITNVRLIKNRNLGLNLFVFFSSISLCILFFIFLKNYFFIQFAGISLLFLVILISIQTKRFSYRLLINKGLGEYDELLISKNNLPYVVHFISMVKNRKEGFKTNDSLNLFDRIA